MALTKGVKEKSLSIEVKSGTDSKGADTYSKKSFSGLKTDVNPQNVYDVAEAIKGVLSEPTRAYYLNTTSSLMNE